MIIFLPQKFQIPSTKLQINLKFKYSMTETGRFERSVSYVWKFGFWSLEFV